MKHRKKIFFIFLVNLLCIAAGCKQAHIIESFDAPVIGPLVFDGENFLLKGSGFLWKMDKQGNILSYTPEPFPEIRSMHYDGNFFWISLIQDNEGLVYKVDKDMNIIDSFVIPTPCFPNGIVFDGKYIWIADGFALVLYKLDTSGIILDSFRLPTELKNITFDGQYLWGIHLGINWGDFGSIIRMDMAGNTKDIYKVRFFPIGITFDGTDLWVSGQTLQNERQLFRISAN